MHTQQTAPRVLFSHRARSIANDRRLSNGQRKLASVIAHESDLQRAVAALKAKWGAR